MIKPLLIVLSLLLPLSVFAISSPVKLEKANVNVHDKASLERGGKFFASNCLSCHALQYTRYDKLVQSVGITYDKMPLKDQDWWFGVAPPDLSLISRQRGADWLYTYLHAFYADPSRELGSNNLLVPKSAMPNPFMGLQGKQVLTVDAKKLYTNRDWRKQHYFNVLKLEKQGSMSAEQFDKATNDLVNFLVYVGEPARVAREKWGWWVLGFLFIFLILAYFLKKEFWRDIK